MASRASAASVAARPVPSAAGAGRGAAGAPPLPPPIPGASASPSTQRASAFQSSRPRAVASRGAERAAFLALALLALLAARVLVPLPTLSAPGAYRAEVLSQIDATRAELATADALLTERDLDARLDADPAWIAAYSAAVDALDARRQAAAALAPPGQDAALQTCLSESLRLLWTGHDLLRQGFHADGHNAYYHSSHGNWDVNLGVNRLRTCEAMARA